jgi:hypothetical protein
MSNNPIIYPTCHTYYLRLANFKTFKIMICNGLPYLPYLPYLCPRVCMCAHTRPRPRTPAHTPTRVCMCVYVCVVGVEGMAMLGKCMILKNENLPYLWLTSSIPDLGWANGM